MEWALDLLYIVASFFFKFHEFKLCIYIFSTCQSENWLVLGDNSCVCGGQGGSVAVRGVEYSYRNNRDLSYSSFSKGSTRLIKKQVFRLISPMLTRNCSGVIRTFCSFSILEKNTYVKKLNLILLFMP